MTDKLFTSVKADAAAKRQDEGRHVTLVSVGVNVVLTTMQLIVGFWAHSQSLIADAIHTLSDIVADAFVLVANHKSGEAADAEHPYGHGRYETAASLVLGLLLAVTGGGILVAAAQRLSNLDQIPAVATAAMWAALATLAGKEGLFRYMLANAERLRSPMLVANAWHARADALSSLVVAIGIGASLAGFPMADAIAAIIVGAMIARVGLRFAWDATQELIDTGLSSQEVAALRATISQTPGVLDLHELRTRRMAHQVLVDAHVRVDSRISVSEGHRIAEHARERVLAKHDEVLDVLVHVDAEDDIEPTSGENVSPDRGALTAHLEALLGQPLTGDDHLVLHYLDNSVEADLTLSKASYAGLSARGVILSELLGSQTAGRQFSAIRVGQRIF